MSELKIFAFEGAEVRTVLVDGEPWWVALDVCSVLDIQSGRALARLDDDEKGLRSTHTPGGQQMLTYVNEPGLYTLVLGSRKPQAKAFKRWITHEVIPSIRKTGQYGAPPALPSNRDLALMVIAESDRAAQAEAKVKELEPSARSWDVLASTNGDFSLRDAAHVLNRDPNISTGQQRLMKTIRLFGMVDRNGIPYAKHSAHLVERPQTYKHPHTGEETLAKPQIRVTVQGLRYLHRKLGGVAPLRFEQMTLRDAG